MAGNKYAYYLDSGSCVNSASLLYELLYDARTVLLILGDDSGAS